MCFSERLVIHQRRHIPIPIRHHSRRKPVLMKVVGHTAFVLRKHPAPGVDILSQQRASASVVLGDDLIAFPNVTRDRVSI